MDQNRREELIKKN